MRAVRVKVTINLKQNTILSYVSLFENFPIALMQTMGLRPVTGAKLYWGKKRGAPGVVGVVCW